MRRRLSRFSAIIAFIVAWEGIKMVGRNSDQTAHVTILVALVFVAMRQTFLANRAALSAAFVTIK